MSSRWIQHREKRKQNHIEEYTIRDGYMKKHTEINLGIPFWKRGKEQHNDKNTFIEDNYDE